MAETAVHEKYEISYEAILGLGKAPRTAYQYARVLDRILGGLEERGVDLETCSAADVAVVADTFSASHSMRCIVRAAFLAGWEIIGRDHPPVKALRIPPRPRTRCRALPEETSKELERAAWDRRHSEAGLAVLIGLYAGLRRFEIARLCWEDILDDEHGHPEWLRVHGKGDVVAEVPLHPILIELLAELRRPAGWLFPGRWDSRPVVPQTIWEWTREIARAAGLGNVPTHVLRHTALAECNDRSGDLRAVQEIARHSRPEITAGYTRTTAARLKQVVSLIDYGRGSA